MHQLDCLYLNAIAAIDFHLTFVIFPDDTKLDNPLRNLKSKFALQKSYRHNGENFP